jgi:hypothetical protein
MNRPVAQPEVVYRCDLGHVVKCECGLLQLTFGNVLTQLNWMGFLNLADSIRFMWNDLRDTTEGQRILIRTPHEGLYVSLFPHEMRQLVELLNYAELQLRAEALLEEGAVEFHQEKKG